MPPPHENYLRPFPSSRRPPLQRSILPIVPNACIMPRTQVLHYPHRQVHPQVRVQVRVTRAIVPIRHVEGVPSVSVP